MYYATVPRGRPRCPKCSHTRDPSIFGSTPDPCLSIRPAPSLFRMIRGNSRAPCMRPARRFASAGLTADAWSRTRTSPGGRLQLGGKWPNANASSARPRLSYQIAFSMAVHCCSPQPCLARLPRGQSDARGPIENSIFPFAQNSRANSKTSAASRPCGAIARRPFPEL